MYTSPATPAGTGRSRPSSTYTLVLAMGCPTGTGPLTDSTRWSVDQTVVSVGPYTFHSSPTFGRSAAASSGGIGSPPHSAFRPRSPAHPDAASTRQVEGVA